MKLIKRIFSPHLILIYLILIIGSALRFHDLPTNPPSLNWDEVAFAYNAHSILLTGKDEFGKSFPLYFRSLDDYKLPVYVYMTVISESIFGYNNFAVRFPSAFFGSLSIFLVYLLASNLYKNRAIALISPLLFAIIPWHIQFSRMAAEATVGLFFLLLGLLFLLYGLTRQKWFFLLSFFAFAIAQYTYLSFRFMIPLLVLIIVTLNFKHLFKKSIFVNITFLLILVFSTVIAYDIYLNRNNSRTTGIAAVTGITTQYRQDITSLIHDGTLGINLPRRILHDSHIFSTIDILGSNYLSHFSPVFIFFDLGQKRHYTPMTGLAYLWMLPFICLGLFYTLREFKKASLTIIPLTLLVPLPAAFAFDSPNAIRTIAFTFPISVLTAVGIYYLWIKINKKALLFKTAFIAFIVFITSFSLFRFIHQNSIHLPHERSSQWQYGRKEMTDYLLKNGNKYNKIIISTRLEWPNIFYLYYSKYSPAKYLKQGGTISGSWSEEGNRIDNMEFHQFDYGSYSSRQKTLFIGTPDDFPKDLKSLHTLKYLDGTPAILMAEK